MKATHFSIDEKDDVCKICPPQARNVPHDGGYPPWENRRSATLPCKHRYTNKSICSVPCDNRDDLCSGFEDEMNCGVPHLVQILPFAVVLMIALSLTIYDLWSLRGHKLLAIVNDASLSLLPSASNSIQECMLITPSQYKQGMRGHQEYKESLLNLVSKENSVRENLLELR